MSSRFYTLKKDTTTKKIKAGSYNELCVKTANSFQANPNKLLLEFEEPSGEQITLDSEDTYEFMEQLIDDESSRKTQWKLVIVVKSQDVAQTSMILRASEVSSTSVINSKSKPVAVSKQINDYESAKTIFKDLSVANTTVLTVDQSETKPISEPEDSKEVNAAEAYDLKSPALSSISKVEEEKESKALIGQKTQLMLNDMEPDLRGMGVEYYGNEEDYMFRQQTIKPDEPPKVETAPQIVPKASNEAPQFDPPMPALPDLEHKASQDQYMQFDRNMDAILNDINRTCVPRSERPASEINIGQAIQNQQSVSSKDTDTNIRRLDTNRTEVMRAPSATQESLEGHNQHEPLQKTTTQHIIAAPIINQPAAQQNQKNLQVPFARNETQTSFVTDFSMKDYSQLGGERQSAQMTQRESVLTQQLNQCRKMLESMMQGYNRQRQEIQNQRIQIDELKKRNQELQKNASQPQLMQTIPCFRCDGRQTEKGRSDPCRRCKGTGRVNTNHEKVLLEMIQAQIEKHVPAAIQQKDNQNEPQVAHQGITCYNCKSSPLMGTRYLCLVCEDFNLCERCEPQLQHSRVHAMAVISEPSLSPDELIKSQIELSERQKAIRAQEIISQSLLRQTTLESLSEFQAKFQYMSLKRNGVFKNSDEIENIYTFKNTGMSKIPAGCRLLWVAGDQELNVNNVFIAQDVRPEAFFKLRVYLKAPNQPKHYNAVYQLIDLTGNTFGDKIELDIIVEDDCSESVILQELMEGVGDFQTANKQPLREERYSMMIHRDIKPNSARDPTLVAADKSLGASTQQAKPPVSPRQPQSDPPGQPHHVPGFGQSDPSNQPQHVPGFGQPMQPSAMMQPPMMPHTQMQPGPMQQPILQPPPGIPAPGMQHNQALTGWGMAPHMQAPAQQKPIEQSAFEDNDANQNNPGAAFMQPNPAAQPWAQPPQIAPLGVSNPPEMKPEPQAQDFFNSGPMRYPTMSGLNVDQAGLVSDKQVNIEEKKEVPAEPKPKPDSVPIEFQQQYGNVPPPVNVAPTDVSEPKTYNDKLNQAFPSSKNNTDPMNRQLREVFFMMKDFGYDDYDKSYPVIMQYKENGKLDNMMNIQQDLERTYNAAGRGSINLGQQPPRMAPQQRTQTQPAAAAFVPPGQPFMQVMPPQESMAVKNAKLAYTTRLNKKKPKEPYRTTMIQLMELGYTDYDKNWKLVKKEKKPDISKILDQLSRM